MKVVIIKYDAGNIRSVGFALNRLGVEPVVTDNLDKILTAERVILPGVGEARAAMESLSRSGIAEIFPALRQPVLGICLGMQLLARHSEERDTKCFNVVDGLVRRFSVPRKVPHVGWNSLQETSGSLFRGVPDNSFAYFVHSYYLDCGSYTSAITEYGEKFSAAVQQENFYGVQFHPEKSGKLGSLVLRNFLELEWR